MPAGAGRVAVVTGAGSGVGRATAQALAGRGLRVVCVGRRAAALRETAELIGDAAVVVPADVASEDGVAAVCRAVAGDTVATLVHAAGIEGLVPFAETARSTFETLIATNLGGPFFLRKRSSSGSAKAGRWSSSGAWRPCAAATGTPRMRRARRACAG